MVVEWDRFFLPRSGDRSRLQLARPLDTSIAMPMFELPASVADDTSKLGQNLAYRNLLRGENGLNLPTGQEVAQELVARGLIEPADVLGGDTLLDIKVHQPVNGTDRDLAGTGISVSALREAISAHTPLWYYVLHESAVQTQGERLGKVGGRIVAEVVIGLLLSDPGSILRADAGWRPQADECGCPSDGDYRMIDLLEWVRDQRAPDAGAPA